VFEVVLSVAPVDEGRWVPFRGERRCGRRQIEREVGSKPLGQNTRGRRHSAVRVECGEPHGARDVREHAQWAAAAQRVDERGDIDGSPLGVVMEKLALFSLPYPSTAAVRGPTLVDEGRRLRFSLICDDEGRERYASVLFIKPRAFRKRAETYCTAWHVKETYDTVCEVDDSEWVAELRRDAVPEWRDRWVMRHFMIYVDGFGCLEVIAESAELESAVAKNSGGT
jgi:hypothetical protein